MEEKAQWLGTPIFPKRINIVLIGGSNQILKTEDVAEGLVFELIVGRSIETVVQLIDFVAIGSTETFALTNGHSPAFRYQSRSVLPHAKIAKYSIT